MASAATSAGVRDISKIAADVIKNDTQLCKWNRNDLHELAEVGPFLTALGLAIAYRIDWEDVKFRLNDRNVPRKGRKRAV